MTMYSNTPDFETFIETSNIRSLLSFENREIILDNILYLVEHLYQDISRENITQFSLVFDEFSFELLELTKKEMFEEYETTPNILSALNMTFKKLVETLLEESNSKAFGDNELQYLEDCFSHFNLSDKFSKDISERLIASLFLNMLILKNDNTAGHHFEQDILAPAASIIRIVLNLPPSDYTTQIFEIAAKLFKDYDPSSHIPIVKRPNVKCAKIFMDIFYKAELFDDINFFLSDGGVFDNSMYLLLSDIEDEGSFFTISSGILDFFENCHNDIKNNSSIIIESIKFLESNVSNELPVLKHTRRLTSSLLTFEFLECSEISGWKSRLIAVHRKVSKQIQHSIYGTTYKEIFSSPEIYLEYYKKFPSMSDESYDMYCTVIIEEVISEDMLEFILSNELNVLHINHIHELIAFYQTYSINLVKKFRFLRLPLKKFAYKNLDEKYILEVKDGKITFRPCIRKI